MSNKNIEYNEFPNCVWTNSEGRIKSINKIRDYVIECLDKSDEWYLSKKKFKKTGGLFIRFISIFCIFFATIIPILANEYNINAFCASIFFIFATLLISLDKFSGLTSGWTRYMITAQKLTTLKIEFQYTWEEKLHKTSSNNISEDEALSFLNIAKEFSLKHNIIIIDETKEWVNEFITFLNYQEKEVKSK